MAIRLRTAAGCARWNPPTDTPENSQVVLRMTLDPSGSLISCTTVKAADAAVGQSANDSLRSASPFAAMPPTVRCLSRTGLLLTFTVRR